MGLLHFSAFTTDKSGPIRTECILGSSVFTIDPIYGRFFNGFALQIDNWLYENILDKLATELTTTTGISFDIRYDLTERKVIISGSQAHSLVPNTLTEQILGLPSGGYTNQQIVTCSYNPYFVWESTNSTRTNDSELYEAAPDYEERIADSGRTYSIGIDKTIPSRDWRYSNEPRSNIYLESYVQDTPYVFERWLKDLRSGPHPFVIFPSTTLSLNYEDCDGIYEMKAEATKFVPEQVLDGFYDYFHIDFKTRLLARPQQELEDQYINLPVTSSSPLFPVTLTNNGLAGRGCCLYLHAGYSDMQFAQVGSTKDVRITHVNDLSPSLAHSLTNSNSSVLFQGTNNLETAFNINSSQSDYQFLYQLSCSFPGANSNDSISFFLVMELLDTGIGVPDSNFFAIRDAVLQDTFCLSHTGSNKIAFWTYWPTLGYYDYNETANNIPHNEKFTLMIRFDDQNPDSEIFINGQSQGMFYNYFGLPKFRADLFDWFLGINMQNVAIQEVAVYNYYFDNNEINQLSDYAYQTYGIEYTEI